MKLALSRRQMFAACGHRPETQQQVTIAADDGGRLLAIRQHTISQTSTVDDHTELCGVATGFLYACPNLEVTHKLARVNIATPTPSAGARGKFPASSPSNRPSIARIRWQSTRSN